MASISQYDILLKEQPNNELLHFSMGKSLLDMRRFEEAETHLRQALKIKPDWMVVAILIAQCALKRDDKAEAKKYYQYALPLAISQKHEGPEQEIQQALKVIEEMG